MGCAKEHPNRNERKGRQDVPVTPHTVGKKRNGSPLQVEWYGHSGKQLDTSLKSNNKYHATHNCAPNHPVQRKENLHQHTNLIVQSGFTCRSPDQPKGASASKWSLHCAHRALEHGTWFSNTPPPAWTLGGMDLCESTEGTRSCDSVHVLSSRSTKGTGIGQI